MKSKYKRYYDALKGKDFSSPVNQYKNSLNTATEKMNTAETTINASRWVEKGLEIIKEDVLPSLKKQMTQVETGLDSLSQATTKTTDLTNKLGELETLEEKLSSLGGKWEYVEGGDYTQADVDSHNREIDEVEQKIAAKENEIDGIINAINGITFTFTSTASAFSKIITELKENCDFEAKKAEFLGSLDDDSWYIDPKYAHKAKELLLFDNTTGEILKEGDKINMKVGETRILTVRVPHNAGRVKQVIRTSASGDGTFMSGHVVKAVSDINPDPNVVERVNYKYSIYWPKDMSILRTNYYDWIITATETGEVQISQTCEYKVEENGGTPKAMVDIHVSVT